MFFFRYDGDSLSGRTLESTGNLAILTFKANGRITAKGFQATVEKVGWFDVSNLVKYR